MKVIVVNDSKGKLVGVLHAPVKLENLAYAIQKIDGYMGMTTQVVELSTLARFWDVIENA